MEDYCGALKKDRYLRINQARGAKNTREGGRQPGDGRVMKTKKE